MPDGAAGRARTEADRVVARYVRDEIYPYSAFYRPRLEAAGLVGDRVRSVADLGSLPFTEIDDVADAGALVLRPDPDGIRRSGALGLNARLAFAQLTRRVRSLNEDILEPAYKPVLWLKEHGLLTGCSATDLDRLSELGRQWLEAAGVERYDAIASLLPAGPNLPFWQLALGARRGGVPLLALGDQATASDVAASGATVVAGRPADVERLLRALERDARTGAIDGIRTVLTAGEPLPEGARARIQSLVPAAAVVAAHAPPGVRSLWAECRGGEGLHLSEDADLVELVAEAGVGARPGGDGEVVYTSLGWHGTALVRFRTGVHGRALRGACPGCGRMGPRLALTPALPPFARVLDANPDVAEWQAELRRVGGADELIVYLAPAAPGHPGRLLRTLDRELRATQFVVLSRDRLRERLDEHGDARVLDHRR